MKDICCETCANLIPLGEGDCMCDADPSQLVMEKFAPADDYYWCCGREWMER